MDFCLVPHSVIWWVATLANRVEAATTMGDPTWIIRGALSHRRFVTPPFLTLDCHWNLLSCEPFAPLSPASKPRCSRSAVSPMRASVSFLVCWTTRCVKAGGWDGFNLLTLLEFLRFLTSVGMGAFLVCVCLGASGFFSNRSAIRADLLSSVCWSYCCRLLLCTGHDFFQIKEREKVMCRSRCFSGPCVFSLARISTSKRGSRRNPRDVCWGKP